MMTVNSIKHEKVNDRKKLREQVRERGGRGGEKKRAREIQRVKESEIENETKRGGKD